MQTLSDRFIIGFDQALRTLFAPGTGARPCPRPAEEPPPLTATESEEAARLMRVNHAGEVCAQALYQGQALFARSPAVKTVLDEAAREERDHLAWCAMRLDELGARPSLLNPVWYAGSFTLGVASGLAGDRYSMGFLVETERQVEHHLDAHLGRVPECDRATRVILEAMRDDEIRHGQAGQAHDAADLPGPVRIGMRWVSRLMTRSTYWV